MSVQARDLAVEFAYRFGRMPTVSRAPGRVNLIGEHTDYNDGFVMPAALDFATLTAASQRPDRRLFDKYGGWLQRAKPLTQRLDLLRNDFP